MEGSELAHTVSEMVSATVNSCGPVASVLGNVGGWVVSQTAGVVFGNVAQPKIEQLCEALRRKQHERAIEPDYESTPHGAKLLQDALNALLNGIDEQRAEAVKNVFLGLAMNPTEDSKKKVEQLFILELAASLETWELVVLNDLQRVSMDYLRPESAKRFIESSRKHPEDEQLSLLKSQFPPFMKRLSDLCSGDIEHMRHWELAYNSLDAKHVVTHYSPANIQSEWFSYMQDHVLTELGIRLRTYLFSADATRLNPTANGE